jgi:hypothetical protein
MRQFRTWLTKQKGNLLLMPEYFRALAKEWLNILFGETLVGIGFLIWWALGAPTNHALVVVFVIAMFVAGYYAWCADHKRLEPTFEITRVIPQTWTDSENGKHGMAYYFEVINKSETTSILEAEVQLSEIVPTVENLQWLPVPLIHKHDRSVPREKTFNLHPGKPKHIDFVSAFEKSNQFTVLHSISGVNSQVVGREPRRLKVTITGRDIPSLSRWFEVSFSSEGFFICILEVAK